MAKLAALLAVAAILCGVVLAQQQPQPQPQQQEKQQPEDLPNPEGRTELPVQGRPIRARQRFRPRPVRPQNRVDIVRPRRPAQVCKYRVVVRRLIVHLYWVVFANSGKFPLA